jgi:hypothetical protein
VLLRKFLAVVEKQFLTNINITQSNELDAMFAVDEHDFCFAVQTVFFIVRVVDEPGFVAVTCGVDDPVAVEVKEEGEELAVVNDTATLGFGRGDDLVRG